MKFLFKQPQLYRFLNYCDEGELEKIVLDCGAGGDYPPLALFSEYGYKTQGIEISDLQIEKANKAAGTRARKSSLDLEKLLKEFRKVSVEESKK